MGSLVYTTTYARVATTPEAHDMYAMHASDVLDGVAGGGVTTSGSQVDCSA